MISVRGSPIGLAVLWWSTGGRRAGWLATSLPLCEEQREDSSVTVPALHVGSPLECNSADNRLCVYVVCVLAEQGVGKTGSVPRASGLNVVRCCCELKTKGALSLRFSTLPPIGLGLVFGVNSTLPYLGTRYRAGG